MGKLFFLLKVIAFAAIVALILQIKVGTSTLEEKVLKVAGSEPVSKTIQKFGIKFLSFTKKQYSDWSVQIDSFLQNGLNELQKKSESENPKEDKNL